MISTDLAYALDPVLFAQSLGIEPDDWQADLLRERPQRQMLLCSRQAGKSTVAAILALWTALYEAPALILLVSPSLRQSQEIFRSTMQFYQKVRGDKALLAENLLKAEFPNGSRILALPGSPTTIRGLASVDLICLDEASRIDRSGSESLIESIRPMMATKPNARMIALTTPAGKRGWFYETWTKSRDWQKLEMPATKIKRISPEFLAEELRELGPAKFGQEYLCEFLEDDAQVFPLGVIDAAFSEEVEPLWS